MTSNTDATRARSEAGSVFVLVMTMMGALFAAGATAMYLQVSSLKQIGVQKKWSSSLYCAEAGMAAARATFRNNYQDWGLILDTDPSNDPAWYPVTGDIEGDGTVDWTVTAKDNADEPLPAADNPNADIDMSIFMVGTCTKYPQYTRQTLELVAFSGSPTIHRDMAGFGAGGTGNQN